MYISRDYQILEFLTHCDAKSRVYRLLEVAVFHNFIFSPDWQIHVGFWQKYETSFGYYYVHIETTWS
jgi:hypothetical protein